MSKTTIYYPDVSDYQSGLTLEANTVALVAKASQGTSDQAASFATFKSQAAAQGSIFSGYHFLEYGNGAAQAQNYFNVAGSIPCMIDCEQDGSSVPGVQDCLDFWDELRALGGRVWAVYFPAWYWNTIGSPDLSTLSSLAVVASDYNAYSDTSSGWDSYGGVSPAVLQFSDTFNYGGLQVDFNAYRGTVEQFSAIVNGAPAVVDSGPVTPVPTKTSALQEEDMNTTSVNGNAGLSWGQGSRHVIQVVWDGATPTFRVVLVLSTGPLVLEAAWKPAAAGWGVLQIPANVIANCKGVILEAAANSSTYYVTAV